MSSKEVKSVNEFSVSENSEAFVKSREIKDFSTDINLVAGTNVKESSKVLSEEKLTEEVIIDDLIKHGNKRELERYLSIYSNQKVLLSELLKSTTIPEDTRVAYENRFVFLKALIVGINQALS